jgi:O-antigen/teichoic acid export membrane protein
MRPTAPSVDPQRNESEARRSPVARACAEWRQGWSMVRLRPFETDTPHGRSQERYRRIALTTLSGFALHGIGMITGLFSVPLVLAYLGKERFGLWSAITTVVAWAGIFNLGIANGLVNCLARAHGRDDEAEARRYLATAFFLLLGIAATLALGLAIGAWRVPWAEVFAARGAVAEPVVRWSVVAALGAFIAGVPLSVVPQIYAAYQRTYISNVYVGVGMVGGFVALVAALRAEASLPVLVLVFGIGTPMAAALALAHALRLSMPWLRFRVADVSAAAARALMQRSVPLFMYQVAALVINETQAIILAHRCDLGVVADYAIAMRIYLLIGALIHVGTAPFVPSFREAFERGDHAWLRASFRRFVALRTFLAVGGALGMLLLGNLVLRLWLRRSDFVFGSAVWATFGLQMIMVARATAHTDLLSIMDRIWSLVALAFLNGIVAMSLTYLLARELGVLGVAIASSTVPVIVFSWLLPRMSRALIGGRDAL